MLSFSFALSAIVLTIWVVLTFFRGTFWQVRSFDDDVLPHIELNSWPRVAAIIPARNEAETIARSVQSLTAQSYAGEFCIFVVDDHSEDSTAEIALQAAQSGPDTHPVTIVTAESLAPGWTGKLWAMQQGVHKAAVVKPDFFWFTDADIVHAPDTLQRLVSRAQGERRDLVSLMVLLRARTFAERFLIPAFLYFFLQLYVPRWIANPKASAAGAAGGCILLRASALQNAGGLSAIRAEMIDDCALARVVKRSGGAIWLGVTRTSISLRAYEGFGEIRDMIARSAFTQLRYSYLLLLCTILGLVLTYIVPVVLAFSPQPSVWRLSLAAWVLMTLTYLPSVKFYAISPLWAPLLPVAAVFYLYATWLSGVRYWRGRGGQWKGRTQAPVKP